MGAGTGFEIDFADDNHIEWVGKEFMPHGHLINAGLDAIQDSCLFAIGGRNVGIIKFGSIFLTRPALLLFPGIGEIEGGVTTYFGNQVQGALPHHLQGLVVAKSTVHDPIDQVEVKPNERQQFFEHGLDVNQIGFEDYLPAVLVLASFGPPSLPGLFFALFLWLLFVQLLLWLFLFEHLFHHHRIGGACFDAYQRQGKER